MGRFQTSRELKTGITAREEYIKSITIPVEVARPGLKGSKSCSVLSYPHEK